MAKYERRKKNKNYLFINTGTKATPVWVRETKASDFAIAYNPQTETYNYIADELPTTETTSFQPAIEQTLYAYDGEPAYMYLIEKARSFARGSDAESQIMLVYQESDSDGENLADVFDVTFGWGTDDMVAGTLAYTINLTGMPKRGTAVIAQTADADGNTVWTPTFTEA
jgi:hypothetical protein